MSKMMDVSVVVVKKLKAEEITACFCEEHGIGSRSAAACREELGRCLLSNTSKNSCFSCYTCVLN